MKKAEYELERANRIAKESKFWECPDIGIFSHCLLTRHNFNMLKQKVRKQELFEQGSNPDSFKDTFIKEDHTLMSDEETQAYIEAMLGQCKKLINRCGGVGKLRMREDDCPIYLVVMMEKFCLSADDLADNAL